MFSVNFWTARSAAARINSSSVARLADVTLVE